MSTSLSTLLTKTRDLLDESSADRWADAELTRYINQGMRQVQSQIQAANEDYFLRVEVATASAGNYELAFPSNIWGNKMRGVWYYDNTVSASGTAYRVQPDSLENVYANLNTSGLPSSYTFHAGYIRWAEPLANNGTFRFVYAMKETDLSSGTDVIAQIADEHTDCISLYAGIMARMKIGADTKELYSLYKDRMNQIQNDVQPLDPFTITQRRID